MSMAGPIGTRLDRYQLEGLLGSGGFGAVYRARHVHTEAAVALKVLKRALGADPQMVERFLREAKAAASVGSDHIVRVLDAGHDAHGTPFLVLELLEGVDLQGLAQREGPLAPMRVVLLCLQVLEGLEAAHQKGIVHRDMKPANAFVVRKVDDRGTERDFVKLLDFGISKMHADGNPKTGLTMTGMAMGTPSYMAPEQFFDARSVDARADVYSVAAMMYELLSGKLPLEATSYADLIVKVRTEAPPHLALVVPGLPRPLADAVMVGLAKEKEQRWPSAREFALGLRAAMGLPQPGNTPLPPRSSGPAPTPASPAIDSASMMLGATAAPKQATPAHALAGGATPQRPQTSAAAQGPAAGSPQRQPTPAGAPAEPPQGWAAPTPGGAAPQRPPSAAPAVAAPQTPQGWVVPGASGGVTPAPMAPQAAPVGLPPPAPSSGGAMKWVLIIGGVLVTSCCACLGLAMAFGDSTPTSAVNEPAPEPPALTGPQEPALDEAPNALEALEPVEAPKPKRKLGKPGKTKPMTTEDAEALRESDPSGTQIYDSLKLDPATEPADEGMPTREEFIEGLKAKGLREDSPKFRRKVQLFDRIMELNQKRDDGTLTPSDLVEMQKILRETERL
jgi:serine/threonine-protein kinase